MGEQRQKDLNLLQLQRVQDIDIDQVLISIIKKKLRRLFVDYSDLLCLIEKYLGLYVSAFILVFVLSQVVLKYATTHNQQQPSATTRNYPQPSTTTRNYPQPSTIIHNHAQLPRKPPITSHNHPQLPKNYSKKPRLVTNSNITALYMLILKHTVTFDSYMKQ